MSLLQNLWLCLWCANQRRIYFTFSLSMCETWVVKSKLWYFHFFSMRWWYHSIAIQNFQQTKWTFILRGGGIFRCCFLGTFAHFTFPGCNRFICFPNSVLCALIGLIMCFVVMWHICGISTPFVSPVIWAIAYIQTTCQKYNFLSPRIYWNPLNIHHLSPIYLYQ